MKTPSRTEIFNRTSAKVFQCYHDLVVAGIHMKTVYWYCRWYLKHMLGDRKKTAEGNDVKQEAGLQHTGINYQQ